MLTVKCEPIVPNTAISVCSTPAASNSFILSTSYKLLFVICILNLELIIALNTFCLSKSGALKSNFCTSTPFSFIVNLFSYSVPINILLSSLKFNNKHNCLIASTLSW
jgi:hypothetical protein